MGRVGPGQEITPLLIQDLLEIFSGGCCPRSPPEVLSFPDVWKVPKNKTDKSGPWAAVPAKFGWYLRKIEPFK